jgi:hypothetical protein
MPGLDLYIGVMRRRIGASQYRYLDDETVFYRKGIRDDVYAVDVALTPTGFDGNENTDWENLLTLQSDEDNIIINIDSGVSGYRDLVRDGAYVIDVELTETGFDGDENIDWENIVIIKPE